MSDPYDLLSLAEAKTVLRIDTQDTNNDTLLASTITALSRRLDEYIGPTVARAVTSEVHSGGRPRIELNYCPVQAVTLLREYQSTNPVTLTENTATLEPTDGWYGERYSPDPTLYSGIIIRTISGFDSRFWSGRGNVVCSYTAGRVASTTLVPDRIKESARLTLRNWWRQYEQSAGGYEEFDVPVTNFPKRSLPLAACMLVHDLWQVEVGFGFGS